MQVRLANEEHSTETVISIERAPWQCTYQETEIINNMLCGSGNCVCGFIPVVLTPAGLTVMQRYSAIGHPLWSIEEMRAMPSFLVDIGNSSDGQVGACVRVDAETAEDAVAEACSALGDQDGADINTGGFPNIEYARIYINPDNITVKDVSEGD